jgi:hypothetical protein
MSDDEAFPTPENVITTHPVLEVVKFSNPSVTFCQAAVEAEKTISFALELM